MRLMEKDCVGDVDGVGEIDDDDDDDDDVDVGNLCVVDKACHVDEVGQMCRWCG